MPRRFAQLPLALLVAAAIATQGFAPPPAYGQTQGTQGLQGGWAIDDKGEFDFEYSTYGQLDLMRQAGAGWVRVNFRLSKCFKNWTTPGCRADGKTAVQVYDQLIREIQARGLKTFGLLSNESSKEGGQAQWNGQ